MARKRYESTADRQQKKTKSKWRKGMLKYAFAGAVAWGATGYYFPAATQVVSETIEQNVSEYSQKMGIDNILSSGSEDPSATGNQLYRDDELKVFGEGAQSAFFANIADRWYASIGRYEVLMNDAGNRGRMNQWFSQLDHLKGKSIADKAAGVDAIVDQHIEYTQDNVLYKKADYWASPIESLTHGKGDCDDYAIMKYFALRYLDVPQDHLYVVAVGPKNGNKVDHATLLVDVKESTWSQSLAKWALPKWAEDFFELNRETDFQVLDNDGSETGRLIQEDRSNYKPYYAMNEGNFWKVPEKNSFWKPGK